MYYIALLNFIHVLGSIKIFYLSHFLTLLAPATVKNPPVNEKTRENSSPLKGPPPPHTSQFFLEPPYSHTFCPRFFFTLNSVIWKGVLSYCIYDDCFFRWEQILILFAKTWGFFTYFLRQRSATFDSACFCLVFQF